MRLLTAAPKTFHLNTSRDWIPQRWTGSSTFSSRLLARWVAFSASLPQNSSLQGTALKALEGVDGRKGLEFSRREDTASGIRHCDIFGSSGEFFHRVSAGALALHARLCPLSWVLLPREGSCQGACGTWSRLTRPRYLPCPAKRSERSRHTRTSTTRERACLCTSALTSLAPR